MKLLFLIFFLLNIIVSKFLICCKFQLNVDAKSPKVKTQDIFNLNRFLMGQPIDI